LNSTSYSSEKKFPGNTGSTQQQLSSTKFAHQKVLKVNQQHFVNIPQNVGPYENYIMVSLLEEERTYLIWVTYELAKLFEKQVADCTRDFKLQTNNH
jgi:hypothetical protein